MNAKIWKISSMIMFAVCPICVQDSIYKLSSMSPDNAMNSGIAVFVVEGEKTILWI